MRDGFTESYARVVITRHGVAKLMDDDMRLHNGIVIRKDCVITIPGKMNRALHTGDWLAFDGTLTRANGKAEALRPAD